MDRLRQVMATLEANNAWRAKTLNLIASENVLSSAARAVLDSDLLHRYAEGHPGGRYYEGTKFVDQIESELNRQVRALFGTSWADVRAISGTVANEAVFSRVVPQGATAIAHTIAGGGHISHARIGSLGKRTKNILPWPTEEDGYTIDVPAARDLIAKEKPAIVVFGRSLFLMPEPVEALADVCREAGTRIFFDGAHVLGLICGGEFQNPLTEGADAMCGSTHKTFFGPQRGVVLSRGDDEDLCKTLDKGVFPGSSSNHHLFSLPSLLVASYEMEAFGAQYAKDTIANARAFAAALDALGMHVALKDRGFTSSHQVALDVGDYGGGKDVSAKLCEQNIICNMNLLPGEPSKKALNPRGLRLGVQEMTRFGMGPDEMGEIAQLLHASVVNGVDVTSDVEALRERYQDVGYGYDADDLSPETVLGASGSGAGFRPQQ